MKDNFSKENKDLLEVIGVPETETLQAVRNMMVNNRSIEQDFKIDGAMRCEPV